MKIRLQNFQGHIDSNIETAPGITAITGSTNAGKSSFLRALQHLHQNTLRGSAYVTHGEDKCTITVDNVQRIKSKGLNQYIVDGNVTEALRSGVPHEVTEALKLSNDFLQTQHSSIFLIDKPAGQVAQKLSELIDLDVAHRAIKLADSERKAIATKVAAANSGIMNAQARIQELKLAQEASDKLASLERKVTVINELTVTLTTVQVTLNTAVECKLAIDNLPDITVLNDLPELMETARNLDADKVALQNIRNKVAAAQKWGKKKLDIPSFTKEISDIRNALSLLCKIRSCVTNMKEFKKQMNSYENALKVKQKEYKDVRGERCPLCGGEYSKKNQHSHQAEKTS